MDSEQQARNMYIYLGLDSIFSLDLNKLVLSKKKPELEKVFPLPDTGLLFPGNPLEGLFIEDSKLHFIGHVNTKNEGMVFSFNLPSFSPDYSDHFPSYCPYGFRKPVVFTSTSNKVYALESTLNRPYSFIEVFEPEIGEWKSVPPHLDYDVAPSPHIPFPTLFVFRNNILLQTSYGDLIFDENADVPNWKIISYDLFPRIWAALEYQDFLFVFSKDTYKLVVYELASFGEIASFSREIDIWYDPLIFDELDIHWASLNYVGNNRLCLVFISNDKIYVFVIRFMKTFIYAILESHHEYYIPEFKKSSDVSLYSTLIWGADINCDEREENPAISQHLTKADQIEENAMDHNQDRYLCIYLGFGALLSLNINELYKRDESSLESKLDLGLVFSHDNKGAEFPIGMGLFAWDSNLHFFGGEILEVSKNDMYYKDYGFREFSNFVGLKPYVRPKYFKHCYDDFPEIGSGSASEILKFSEWSSKKLELTDEWFNMKVFSFNLPYFTSYNTRLPNHSGCKLRPLVFTISDKIYALSTKTVSSISVSSFEVDKDKPKLFEVFEPEKNKWRHIDRVPSNLYKEILDNYLQIESHCVFRDKMLLQTFNGDYVFDSVSEEWDESEMWYPKIYSALEYNEEVLLAISRGPVELLVYELASFGKSDSTFGKVDILDIENKIIDVFPGVLVCGASLNRIDHNHISMVLITMENIHVSMFKVEAPFRYAVVEAHKVFDAPKNCFHDIIQPLSTFLLRSDVNQHNDTKAAGPREENSTNMLED